MNHILFHWPSKMPSFGTHIIVWPYSLNLCVEVFFFYFQQVQPLHMVRKWSLSHNKTKEVTLLHIVFWSLVDLNIFISIRIIFDIFILKCFGFRK